MAMKLRRPILVGGLGLTFGMWVWDSLTPPIVNWEGSIVWGAIALGSGAWWLQQRRQRGNFLAAPPALMNRESVERAIAQAESRLHQLEAETIDSSEALAQLQMRLAKLNLDRDRNQLELTVAGGISVGKTTLVNRLQADWLSRISDQVTQSVVIHDTTDSLFGSATATRQPNSHELDADAILFVITGDLTQPEFEFVTQLLNQQQRIILVFNKVDQYLPSERCMILQQIQERISSKMSPHDVIAASTAPSAIKVRQHQLDGTVQEWVEQSLPDLTALIQRLEQVLIQDGEQLMLVATFRKATSLYADIQQQLNQLRRDRALPLIEQYQWIAAAAAFANPVASLDLLATAAINTQLVMDLGTLYQQPFSVEQAKTAAGNVATLLVKLGLVELSTQAISPLLKSNALTFVAGGLLQGISAAYLTRIAGISLVAYFEERSQHLESVDDHPFSIDRLRETLTAVFQQNQRSAFLTTLVKQGIERLTRQDSRQTILPKADGVIVLPASETITAEASQL